MKTAKLDIVKSARELMRDSQLKSGVSLKTRVVRDKRKYTRKAKYKSVED
jgi:hypothetical protein